jgi:hypothetical protein
MSVVEVEVEVVVVVPESTLDRREANTGRVHNSPKGLEFDALQAQPHRGEFFEMYAIAKESIGWKPSCKNKICKGFPCDLHSKNSAEGDPGR